MATATIAVVVEAFHGGRSTFGGPAEASQLMHGRATQAAVVDAGGAIVTSNPSSGEAQGALPFLVVPRRQTTAIAAAPEAGEQRTHAGQPHAPRRR